MIETEKEKIHLQSRDIEFKDDMKDFFMWLELFKEEIENNGAYERIKIEKVLHEHVFSRQNCSITIITE